MRNTIIKIGIIFLITICQNQGLDAINYSQQNIHEVVVVEFIQTSQYTYLLVEENENEYWLAIPKMEVKVSKTYYYKGGMMMKDFKSKELDRTFEEVIFLEGVHAERESVGKPKSIPATHTMKGSTEKSIAEKKDIKIEPAEGGITIAELLSNKESYEGKVVKIRGKVTKFNDSIMKRNWIHLQDGTDHAGEFDLTITTDIFVKVGETIIIEGKIALNKDFGYGYLYEVIMEDGVLK